MQKLGTDLEAHEYAYLTTRGRSTGRPHRIEIWFVVIDGSLWLNSGGRDRSDWVRNVFADATVELEIADARWSARAVVHSELGAHPARERLARRYQGWRPGTSMSDWARDSLLVEILVRDDA